MPKRDFLTIPDFSRAELVALIELARRMKEGRYTERPLAGQTLGMIFTKSSTRTRSSCRRGTFSWAAASRSGTRRACSRAISTAS